MTIMEVESDGLAIKKVRFVLENGERWVPHCPCAEIYQRDGDWMVGWEGGEAGPFKSREFAEAVGEAMR